MRTAKDTGTEFETTRGGGRLAVSVGGSITGRGGNYIIIDDPLKAEEALSRATRDKGNEYLGHTLYSRLDSKVVGVIVLLRLVAPRDGWPSEKAVAAASGADAVLEKARLYPSVEAAIGDLLHVYAATARDRYMVKREVTPRLAAQEMRGWLAAGEPCGVLFGPERTGLVNDHIALADTVLSVPLNPAFSSLNLAQAVLLIGYEWFIASQDPPQETMHTGHSRPATRRSCCAFSTISRRR